MFEIYIAAGCILLITLVIVLGLKSRRRSKVDQSITAVAVESPKPSGRLTKAISNWMPLFKSKSKDRNLWEESLISSDLGPKLTNQILDELEKQDVQTPIDFLKTRLSGLIEGADRSDSPWQQQSPWVIFVIGVNGVGKTTTIVKLAHYFLKSGVRLGVIGADTFRKAAIEQLERGCQRIGADFFSVYGSDGSEGADPAAVVFDGLKKFSDRQVILVDTSGRLHNKKNLMDELKKMKRVADKSIAGAPHDVWMVVDATQGQNAVAQGVSFNEAMTLTGLIVTKMDGLSRGGTLFQLFDELKTPIRFLGYGETEKDLETFKSATFIEELFDQPSSNS